MPAAGRVVVLERQRDVLNPWALIPGNDFHACVTMGTVNHLKLDGARAGVVEYVRGQLVDARHHAMPLDDVKAIFVGQLGSDATRNENVVLIGYRDSYGPRFHLNSFAGCTLWNVALGARFFFRVRPFDFPYIKCASAGTAGDALKARGCKRLSRLPMSLAGIFFSLSGKFPWFGLPRFSALRSDGAQAGTGGKSRFPSPHPVPCCCHR